MEKQTWQVSVKVWQIVIYVHAKVVVSSGADETCQVFNQNGLSGLKPWESIYLESRNLFVFDIEKANFYLATSTFI